MLKKYLIIEELHRIEREYDGKILMAVESGSRAWGFTSLDRDYDVSFIYVNRPKWYFLSANSPTQSKICRVTDLLINDWSLSELDVILYELDVILYLYVSGIKRVYVKGKGIGIIYADTFTVAECLFECFLRVI